VRRGAARRGAAQRGSRRRPNEPKRHPTEIDRTQEKGSQRAAKVDSGEAAEEPFGPLRSALTVTSMFCLQRTNVLEKKRKNGLIFNRLNGILSFKSTYFFLLLLLFVGQDKE